MPFFSNCKITISQHLKTKILSGRWVISTVIVAQFARKLHGKNSEAPLENMCMSSDWSTRVQQATFHLTSKRVNTSIDKTT